MGATLRCCGQTSYGGSFSCCRAQALGAGFSNCSSQALEHTSSVVVVHGLSCSSASGIITDQGLNPSPLHWQVDSYPLQYQGSPQFNSVAKSCPTLVSPWTVAQQASLSIIDSQSLLKLMSLESVMPSNCLILCHPLLLPPSVIPSIRVFFNWISSSHQVTKVLEFQLQHISLLSYYLSWKTPACLADPTHRLRSQA